MRFIERIKNWLSDTELYELETEIRTVTESGVETYETTHSVDLVNLSHTGPMVIEFDSWNGGAPTVRDILEHNYRGWRTSSSEVATINGHNVEYRSNLGEYQVTLKREWTRERDYEVITNLDDLPDEVLDEDGLPKPGRFKDEGLDHDIDEFEETEIVGEPVVAATSWAGNYEYEGETEIEKESSLGEVAQEAITGGTEHMTAITADGEHMLPNSDVGQDANDVKAIPAGDEPIDV